MTRRRAIVIGLDGATFTVIKPLVEQGRLPHLAKLMRDGVHGRLASTIPPLTAPAWISSFTGKQPSRHGVFLFFHYQPERLADGDFPMVTTASIQARTAWEMMNDHGKKVVAVNVPMTYPPLPVDGVMISGMGTPEGSRDFIHPPGLAAEIERDLGFCEIVDPRFRDLAKYGSVHQGLIDSLHRCEDRRSRLTNYLLEREDWDFAMVVFTLTDRVQHFKWGEEEVEKAYAKCDRYIGELLEKTDEDTSVFVMSDHGFGKQDGFLCINKWLRDNGFLAMKRPGWRRLRDGYSFRRVRVSLQRLAIKARVPFLVPLMPRWLRQRMVLVPYFKRNAVKLVDWSRTRAYGSSYGIRINRKGREPHGVVEPGPEEEALKDEILDRLERMTHPDTGERLVDYCFRREKVHTGPLVEEAPDLFYMVKNLAYLQTDRMDSTQLLESTPLKGSHRMHGVFIARGPGFRSGVELADLRIEDVLPAVLYSMDLPIPDDLDGRLPEQGIDQDAMTRAPPAYEAAKDAKERESVRYSRKDEDVLRERLRALGYVD